MTGYGRNAQAETFDGWPQIIKAQHPSSFHALPRQGRW